MLDGVDVVRVGAAVAAACAITSPYLVAAARRAGAWLRATAATKEASTETGLADMKTVLELANRLKVAGNSKGVELCQQLLDVMLSGAKR